MQRVLSDAQVEAFYHDRFVEDQTRHFIELVGEDGPKVVTDVGGGCGCPAVAGPADVVTFNLILHHLVARSERGTRALQRRALALWAPHARAVFVNEYLYESWLGGFSAWLIYAVTRSRVLSWIGRAVSAVLPSLRANTFGVGVRFRRGRDWLRVFDEAGYDVAATATGEAEQVSLPRRLLLIRRIRRDGFLLRPRGPTPGPKVDGDRGRLTPP